tara:strand:+ start:5598 stop:6119 length:522 start_codon:yes stop_codon:yes gene_type:complete
MANDRKIQFATQVIPKTESGLEEYGGSRFNRLHASVNKTLGGKGYMDINATQWGDSWTSMSVLSRTSWGDIDEKWEVAFTNWDDLTGSVPITSSLLQLSSDSSALAFCYIKNTGLNTVKITLQYGAGSPTYPFKLVAGSSVHFKGYSTNLTLNKIGVVRDSSDSTIEYIIAKA